MTSTVVGRTDGRPAPGDRRGLERSNNFTLIRVIAAALVIFDHSYRLVGQPPPLTAFLGYVDIGTIAVYTFFIMSGHLLLSSWKANPQWFLFFFKRFMRIMPGLAFALLFGALLVGPLMTTVPIGDYLGSSQTHEYVTQNLMLFHPLYDLPGVFGPGHNPFTAVNGSIWTLCYEVTLYLLVPMLGFALLRSHRTAGTVALLSLAALPWDRLGTMMPVTWLVTTHLEIFARYFVVGAVLYAHRDRIPRRWFIAAGLAAVWVASFGHPWAPWVSYAVLPYEVVYLARLRIPPLAGVFQRRDPSYGMYLLAFPVQQAVISIARGHISPLTLFLVSTPLTVCLALVSWHFVEAPGMRLRGTLSRQRVRLAGLAGAGGVLLPRRIMVTATAGAIAGVVAALGAYGLERGAAPGQVVASAATVGRSATIATAPASLVPHLLPITARPFTATPKPTPRPKPVLIYLHGLGEPIDHPALPDLLAAAAADGYQVILTEEGGPSTWGNRAAVAAVMALKAKYSPDRPVSLIGCSMGTFTLLNYVAAAAPGSVSAAVGLLPYSHLPTTEHPGTIIASGATDPPQTINIPYQMWYGTADKHAGYPTIHGPHVSLVPMAGVGHDIPMPYNLHAIFSFLDGYRAR